ERTFTPELRSLVDKVTGLKSVPAIDAATLKKFYKLFYRTENRAKSTFRISTQKPQDVAPPVYEASFAAMMQKAAAFAQKVVESGADGIVWAGIDKTAATEIEILRARRHLLLVYERIRQEFKGRAFFLKLRPDSFSVFVRHKDVKNLRDSLNKPDFYGESFYKKEIFFGDSLPDALEMLGIALRL
ncbi:MAG: hypothetical protein FWG92_08580, partial [Leptospirales bacterium]|nr:hypothetical protein [Leptospirales bacterium]